MTIVFMIIIIQHRDHYRHHDHRIMIIVIIIVIILSSWSSYRDHNHRDHHHRDHHQRDHHHHDHLYHSHHQKWTIPPHLLWARLLNVFTCSCAVNFFLIFSGILQLSSSVLSSSFSQHKGKCTSGITSEIFAPFLPPSLDRKCSEEQIPLPSKYCLSINETGTATRLNGILFGASASCGVATSSIPWLKFALFGSFRINEGSLLENSKFKFQGGKYDL